MWNELGQAEQESLKVQLKVGWRVPGRYNIRRLGFHIADEEIEPTEEAAAAYRARELGVGLAYTAVLFGAGWEITHALEGKPVLSQDLQLWRLYALEGQIVHTAMHPFQSFAESQYQSVGEQLRKIHNEIGPLTPKAKVQEILGHMQSVRAGYMRTEAYSIYENGGQ